MALLLEAELLQELSCVRQCTIVLEERHGFFCGCAEVGACGGSSVQVATADA